MGKQRNIPGDVDLVRSVFLSANALGLSGDADLVPVGSIAGQAVKLPADSGKASVFVPTPHGWDDTEAIEVHAYLALHDAQNNGDIASVELAHVFFADASPNERLLSKPLDVNAIDIALSGTKGLSPLTVYAIGATLPVKAGNNRYDRAGPGLLGLRFRLTSVQDVQRLYLLGLRVDFGMKF
jgi:hypothetical protein